MIVTSHSPPALEKIFFFNFFSKPPVLSARGLLFFIFLFYFYLSQLQLHSPALRRGQSAYSTTIIQRRVPTSAHVFFHRSEPSAFHPIVTLTPDLGFDASESLFYLQPWSAPVPTVLSVQRFPVGTIWPDTQTSLRKSFARLRPISSAVAAAGIAVSRLDVDELKADASELSDTSIGICIL